MRLRIISHQEFVLQNLTELLQAANTSEATHFSSAIAFGLTELVRNLAREEAQKYTGIWAEDVLEGAIRAAENLLMEKGAFQHLQFELFHYWEDIRKSLKPSAKEISILRENLKQSKECERVAPRHIIMTEHQISVEISQVGLRNAIEGFLIKPLDLWCHLDTSLLPEMYELESECFPLEVTSSEFTFVIDDDGSVFLAIENFPEVLVWKARDALLLLANQIYT
jgi:hypothetical protein